MYMYYCIYNILMKSNCGFHLTPHNLWVGYGVCGYRYSTWENLTHRLPILNPIFPSHLSDNSSHTDTHS